MSAGPQASPLLTHTPLRRAGLAQGLVLTAVGTLSVMGVVLITPVLPLMDKQFAGMQHAAALVRIALVIPALFIFLLSPLAGMLADRVSRRRMLLASMLVYAAFGTAPLYLQSLGAIIATRIGVGIAEAALMTASTTLIGDYFEGAARERWFAAQTGVAALSGIALLLIGGTLGDLGWRVPFLAYGVSLVMFGAVIPLTWEVAPREDKLETGPFPWARTRAIYATTLFGAAVFYIVPIQLPFILNMHGITVPSRIGLASAIGGAAVPLGSALFAWQARIPVRVLLAVGLTLAGGGLLGLTIAGSYGVVLASVMVNQLGCGLYIPTLLSWAVHDLPFELRGQGSGVWMASFFLGQFISPLLLLAIAGLLGGLLPAITAMAFVSILGAVIAASWRGSARRMPKV